MEQIKGVIFGDFLGIFWGNKKMPRYNHIYIKALQIKVNILSLFCPHLFHFTI